LFEKLIVTQLVEEQPTSFMVPECYAPSSKWKNMYRIWFRTGRRSGNH